MRTRKDLCSWIHLVQSPSLGPECCRRPLTSGRGQGKQSLERTHLNTFASLCMGVTCVPVSCRCQCFLFPSSYLHLFRSDFDRMIGRQHARVTKKNTSFETVFRLEEMCSRQNLSQKSELEFFLVAQSLVLYQETNLEISVAWITLT